MFYLFYNSSGRIIEYQQGGLPGDRQYIEVSSLPDDVFNRAVVDGEIVWYVETEEELALSLKSAEREARILRNKRLSRTDWTQMPDAPFSEEQKAEWRLYRQALRDLTSHKNWPNLQDVDWPVKP